jgi:hypothetical protein
MMRRIWVLTAFLGVLLFATSVNAVITHASAADDNDGAIVCTSSWDVGTSTMNIDGVQYRRPGHIEGSFTTDTELDPTVWIVESVDNYTDFTWTDYHIGIGMNKSFSIVGVVAPPDWTWVITPPVGGQQLPNQPPGTLGWVGTVDYYAGPPIGVGQSGDFGLVVSFAGSVQFCTVQYPTPEPATIALLGLGALSIIRRKRA